MHTQAAAASTTSFQWALVNINGQQNLWIPALIAEQQTVSTHKQIRRLKNEQLNTIHKLCYEIGRLSVIFCSDCLSYPILTGTHENVGCCKCIDFNAHVNLYFNIAIRNIFGTCMSANIIIESVVKHYNKQFIPNSMYPENPALRILFEIIRLSKIDCIVCEFFKTEDDDVHSPECCSKRCFNFTPFCKYYLTALTCTSTVDSVNIMYDSINLFCIKFFKEEFLYFIATQIQNISLKEVIAGDLIQSYLPLVIDKYQLLPCNNFVLNLLPNIRVCYSHM